MNSDDDQERLEIEAEVGEAHGEDEAGIQGMETEDVETLQEDDFQVEIHISDMEEDIEGNLKNNESNDKPEGSLYLVNLI